MPDPTKDSFSLKEIITALLAVGVLGGYLWFGDRLASLPPDTPAEPTAASKARTENTRKVLDGFFAILSAFVGYYAGRIPAEKAAAAAQQVAAQKGDEAQKAQADAQKARGEAREGAALLNKTLPTLRRPPAPPGPPDQLDPGAPGGPALVKEVEAFIDRQLKS